MFDYEENIGSLNDGQRVRFYELLSHNLTVSIRAVWSDDSLANDQKIDQIKWINEILHRTIAKITVERLKTHEWLESDVWNNIQHWVSQNESIGGHVAWAINASYSYVIGRDNQEPA